MQLRDPFIGATYALCHSFSLISVGSTMESFVLFQGVKRISVKDDDMAVDNFNFSYDMLSQLHDCKGYKFK